MNFLDPADRERILKRLHRDTVEVPSPYPHLKKPCRIPKFRVNPDTSICNRYCPIRVNGIALGRHVTAAALNTGELPPPGFVASHLCDRKPCCELSHIVVATWEENKKQALERNRIARGERHGSHTQPERVPRGEKNRMATIISAMAAEIRWCLQNVNEWYTADIEACCDQLTALAIHFNVPRTTLQGIARGGWSHVEPKRPEKLPKTPTKNHLQLLPLPKRGTVLSDADVVAIRIAYYSVENHQHFVRDQAKKYKVSPATIWKVLRQETRSDLTPDIPPVKESGHGMAVIPDSTIQKIRATFDAYWEKNTVDGIISALHRFFKISKGHVRNICERVIRCDVPEDPTAVIPFDQLPFKPLTQRGADHPLSKLNDAVVLEILQRLARGEKKTAIAREKKVSITAISAISVGRSWRHVFAKFKAEQNREKNEEEQ